MVDDLPEVSFVSAANLDPETTVIAVEAEYPAANALLFTGLKCFTGTQPYADIEKWAPVDPEGKWEEVYNRLGHVSLDIAAETSFELVDGDQIRAHLTLKDLQTLGVTTLMTQNNFPDLPVIQENGTWKLYSLE